MQVCSKKSLKSIFAACIFAFSLSFVCAQSLEMPEMPDMPDMPSIGGCFYRPSIPQFEKNKKNNENTGKDNGSTEAILSDGNANQEVLNTILGTDSNILSATDISSLYDSGVFNNLSSLTGNSLVSSASNASTNVLLQQILGSLEDLKTDSKKQSAAEKQALLNRQKDTETFRAREPGILRFKINNYGLTDSISSVFISEPEPDGSFLLTADRKYSANKKSRSETFYMLFKTLKSNGSVTTYEVVPTIAQDSLNKNSYIYKMCQQKNITAEKTGNLVVIHYNEDEFSMDMLLDIDRK